MGLRLSITKRRLMHHRSRQCSFNRPALQETPTKCYFLHADAPCPPGDTHDLSFVLYLFNCFPVIALLFVGSPMAVSWLVIAGAFNPIDTEFGRWPWPQVCIEVLKNMPALADFDAASAVIFVLTSIGIVAPTHHTSPNDALRSIPIRFAVSWLTEAPAGLTQAAQ